MTATTAEQVKDAAIRRGGATATQAAPFHRLKLTVAVKSPTATACSFRASLFDWEELKAELQAPRLRWRANSLVNRHLSPVAQS